MTLVWEGLDLRPSHGRWKLSVAQGRDELPGVRSTSDLIPFRRGRLHKPGIADTRQLELRGYIREETLEAFRATHDTLKGLLDPEMAEPGLLVDDQEDGSQRWIRAVPRPPLLSTYGGGGTRLLSIELEALDPYWYGAWGTLSLDAGYTLDSGLFLDGSTELVITPTSALHETAIDALGTAAIERVRVTLSGPSTTAPGISIATPNGPVGFMFDSPLGLNSELVVDTDNRTVLLNGLSARDRLTVLTANQHGEFFRLLAGANTIRVFGAPVEARFLFNPTYL